MSGLANRTYDLGLVEVADGVHAYLQPDGSWGYSNSGVLVDGDEALLVDTLFTRKLTRTMLDTMKPVLGDAVIRTIVNTHANGDHCFGNQEVPTARMITTEATAEELSELPASALHSLNTMVGPMGDLFRTFFGQFDFSDVTVPPPDETFTGSHAMSVGGTEVALTQLGPAHTSGDCIVHLPSKGVVFTGDLCFIGGTPISWAGPLSAWVSACDAILALDATVIVPGHGPLATVADVVAMRDYLSFVESRSRAGFEAGATSDETCAEIVKDLGDYRNWLDWERVAVNVETAYRSFDPTYRGAPVDQLFMRMGRLLGRVA